MFNIAQNTSSVASLVLNAGTPTDVRTTDWIELGFVQSEQDFPSSAEHEISGQDSRSYFRLVVSFGGCATPAFVNASFQLRVEAKTITPNADKMSQDTRDASIHGFLPV